MKLARPLAAGLVVALVSGQTLQAAAPSQPVSAETPDVLDKGLAKELTKGALLPQLEARNKLPKTAYRPAEELLEPYVRSKVGAPIAYQLVAGTEFADAPEAQALCQQIVDKLLTGWRGPTTAVRVYITAEPYYHAEATETGLILVSLGVFDADPTKGAASVDELALLLGHELSHILLGHLEKSRRMTNAVKALSLSASGFMAYSSASKSTMVGDQLQVKGDSKLYRKGLIGGLTATTLAGDLMTPSFNREKELEADRAGIDLARRAGYLVTEGEVRNFIARHSDDAARQTKRMQALSAVLDALTTEAANKTAKKTGGAVGDLLRTAWSQFSSKLSEQLFKSLAARTKAHPDPEQRRLFGEGYIRAYYPDGETGPDGRLLRRNITGLKTVAERPLTRTLLTRVALAEQVRQGLIDTAADPSEAKTDTAVAGMIKKAGFVSASNPPPVATKGKPAKGKAPPATAAKPAAQRQGGFADDGAAFTWKMQGMLQMAAGKTAEAQSDWRRGVQVRYAPVDLAQRYGHSLPKDQAAAYRSLISRYSDSLGTTDPLLDLQVAAAMAEDDLEAAEVATAKCASYSDGSLYPSCTSYLGYNPMEKATPPRTPGGVSAFAGKSIEKTFKGLNFLSDLF